LPLRFSHPLNNSTMPSPSKLTKESADALCSIVLLGFAKLYPARNEDYAIVHFDPKDAPNYSASNPINALKAPSSYTHVQTVFERYGVALECQATQSKASLPLIFGLSEKNKAQGPQLSTTEVTALSKALDRAAATMQKNHATKKYNELRGAYVGGLSTVASTDIVGPSMLDTYSPAYRSISSAEQTNLTSDFNDAKTATLLATEVIEELSKSRTGGISIGGTKLSTAQLQQLGVATLGSNKLFKSYHGMIQAMAIYASNPQSDYIFELALSDKTEKVASCFPCATFMQANGRPASAIHLGRGDNWNLPPQTTPSQSTAWHTLVYNCYRAGVTALGTARTPTVVDTTIDLVAALVGSQKGVKAVPAIFLEALTFQASFANRVKSTFPS